MEKTRTVGEKMVLKHFICKKFNKQCLMQRKEKYMKKILFVVFYVLILVCVFPSLSIKTYAADITETEDNGSMQNADEITCNGTVSGFLSVWNDVDYYKFTLDSAGSISLNFKHENVMNAGRFWIIKIYNEDTSECLWFSSKGTATDATSGEVGLPAGTYYVRVCSDKGENGNYSSYNYSNATYFLRVNYKQSSNWETEKNDGYRTADPIRVNTVYYGATQYWDDVDYYSFTLSNAGKVSIDFGHPNLLDTKRYWFVKIFNEDTAECVAFSSYGTVTGGTSGEVGLPAGTYYVRVCSDKGENGNYSSYNYSNATYFLRVNYKQSSNWETEKNNGYGTADPIRVNTNYYGATQYWNDMDYYSFTLASEGKVKIKFGHPNLLDTKRYWIAKIIDENTKVCLNLSIYGEEEKAESEEVVLPEGTYYVRVCSDKGENGDYSSYNYSNATYHFTVSFDNSYKITYHLNGGKNNSANPARGYPDSEIVLKAPTRNACYEFAGWYLDANFRQPISKLPKGTNQNVDLYAKWKVLSHNYKDRITCATLKKNGKITSICTVCGTEKKAAVISYPKTIKLSPAKSAYTGEKQKPAVIVKDAKGKTISKSNYKVTYTGGRKNVGKYQVTVTFQGKYYKGTKKLYFTVEPASVQIKTVVPGKKRLKISWTKNNQELNKQVDGYEIVYSTDRNFAKAKTEKIRVEKNATDYKTITGLKGNCRYYVRIRTYKKVSGKNFYSKWSNTVSAITGK